MAYTRAAVPVLLTGTAVYVANIDVGVPVGTCGAFYAAYLCLYAPDVHFAPNNFQLPTCFGIKFKTVYREKKKKKTAGKIEK